MGNYIFSFKDTQSSYTIRRYVKVCKKYFFFFCYHLTAILKRISPFRYGREGHLSYYKLDHLLPPELNLTATEKSFLVSQNVEITHKGMRKIITSMAKSLRVWDIVCPDLLSLVNRYCQELGLPSILIYVYLSSLFISVPTSYFYFFLLILSDFRGHSVIYRKINSFISS